MKKLLLFTALMGLFQITTETMAQETDLPLIGAQVFIEPGQNVQEIDHWFKTLSDHDMNVCRIRLFEDHIHNKNEWDFELYDAAMDKAEKYDVKVFLTLFPSVDKSNVGGSKFPASESHQQSIARYIKKVVNRYKDHPALYCWVLQNEPGRGSLPNNAFTKGKFQEWKKSLPEPSYDSYGYWQMNFYRERFLRHYESQFIQWLSQQVKQYDPDTPHHINPHNIFLLLPEYDFPSWRNSLSSLGASMHPSWHFGYFERNEYPLAVAANSDIIRCGAGNDPWWVTELQGGNNIFSAFNPMNPSSSEISQWLWTSIGSGTEGAIFWCLNPRGTGKEAGEWALLDFQDEPTDRFEEAAAIAKTCKQYASFFNKAEPLKSDISILYNPESFYIQSVSSMQSAGSSHQYAGRREGAVIKSMMGYYQSLIETGIPVDIKEMADYTWDEPKGKTIILPHMLSIPHQYWEPLKFFVENGGKAIITGLSGFYDEHKHNVMHTGAPLKELLGGNLNEVRFTENLFKIGVKGHTLPVHLWKGTIENRHGEIIAQDESGNATGIQHNYGKGQVVWLPSPAGLGAWMKDSAPLGEWLWEELKAEKADLPVSLSKHYGGIVLKTLRAENHYLTVLVNTGNKFQHVGLDMKENLTGKVIYGEGSLSDVHTVVLPPRKTAVILWK